MLWKKDDAITNGSLCKHHHYNWTHTKGTASTFCVVEEKKMVEFHLHIHFQFLYLSLVCPNTIWCSKCWSLAFILDWSLEVVKRACGEGPTWRICSEKERWCSNKWQLIHKKIQQLLIVSFHPWLELGSCEKSMLWERDDATTNGSLCKHHHYNQAHTEGTPSTICVVEEKKW
jgi:hypothetical protein